MKDVFKNISSAAFKLNEQHIPKSVGKALKIDEHGTSIPFHSQNLIKDFSSLHVDVNPK